MTNREEAIMKETNRRHHLIESVAYALREAGQPSERGLFFVVPLGSDYAVFDEICGIPVLHTISIGGCHPAILLAGASAVTWKVAKSFTDGIEFAPHKEGLVEIDKEADKQVCSMTYCSRPAGDSGLCDECYEEVSPDECRTETCSRIPYRRGYCYDCYDARKDEDERARRAARRCGDGRFTSRLGAADG